MKRFLPVLILHHSRHWPGHRAEGDDVCQYLGLWHQGLNKDTGPHQPSAGALYCVTLLQVKNSHDPVTALFSLWLPLIWSKFNTNHTIGFLHSKETQDNQPRHRSLLMSIVSCQLPDDNSSENWLSTVIMTTGTDHWVPLNNSSQVIVM